MLIWEIIKVALNALLANKGRALLTMLGIIIGVGAVITMMAIGEGASKAVQDRITSLGVNLLFVNAERRMTQGVWSGFSALTSDDAVALRDQMTNASAVVPELGQGYQVKHGNVNTNTSINGTTPQYFPVRRYILVSGRFFNDAEVEGRRRVAVMGADAAWNLGSGPAMVGEDIRIGGHTFEVVGVLQAKGSEGFRNPDDQIYIPVTTAQYRLIGTDRVNSITIEVSKPERMNAAAEEVERILRREHKLRFDQENDFRVRNQLDIAETFEATSKTFALLLTGIAAVSLLVGGIGIMNIMLVSVTERTKEIGVRKAIGARRSSILFQFLLEAIVLCVLGGFIGIVLGTWAAKLMADTGGWSVVITPSSIMLAVGFSISVGLFFGIYPASRAARLDPIEALRYE